MTKSDSHLMSYQECCQKLCQEIIEQLTQSGKTLALAESCTGGLISHELTQIPGSSKVFRGSLVAYQTEIKTSILGVSKSILQDHSVVSKEVACEMALKAGKLFNSDYALATTGFLGPTGADNIPVGTVWVALYKGSQDKSSQSEAYTLYTKYLSLNGTRAENKDSTMLEALELLHEVLHNDTQK